MIPIIKKAKISKGRTLEVELIERNEDRTENEVTKKCSQLFHDDCLNAFARLKIHLIKLCDLHEGKDIKPDDFDPSVELQNFEVFAFTISGEEENEGITLSGSKTLPNRKVLNLNTPFTKYFDENDNYEFGNELAADIEACVYEVEQYLFEGKYAVKQLEIEFAENEEEIPVMEKPKKPGRKKKELLETVPKDEDLAGKDFENTPVMEEAI